MRQAGRYLPEFEIRKANPDFIKLCLSHNLAEEITLQPIKRFGFDAAIIFRYINDTMVWVSQLSLKNVQV